MTIRRVTIGLVVLGLWALSACNGSKKTGTLPDGVGYCESTCAKSCGQDADCDTSQGELCCDYGVAGKACSAASACPRTCVDDSRCDSAGGQACVRVDLAVPDKYCTSPSAAIKLCGGDADCSSGSICCTIYNEPICLPPTSCPRACADSNECQTAQGEICCTTVAQAEPALSATGLCLNPAYNPCPKACSQSADCATTAGELCCDGLCQTTCRKTCMASSDCNQQICCKSAPERLPARTRIFTSGPHCAGTPLYTCATCSSNGYCSAGYCPGCTTTGTGSCTGSRLYTCSTYSTSFMSYCVATPGCSWNASTLVCSGNPAACTTITSASVCSSQADCSWSGTSTCSGTPSPCEQLNTSTCSLQPGCTIVTN